MKTIKFLFMASIAMFMLYGCSSVKNVTKEQLADKWMLKSINNRLAADAFPNRTPYLLFNFDIDQVSGNGGCNTYSGKFTYNGGEFVASNLISTMMACADASEESTLLKLLGKKSKLSLVNGELVFLQDNKPVMMFERAKPLSAADLAGTWKLVSMNGKSISEGDAVKTPTLEFNFVENRLHGSTGCNNYNGGFSLENNVLELKPLVTTRMMCPKMDVEQEFVKTFTGRIDIDKDGNKLVLRKDNKTIMHFSK
ncbi:META domain-containing protein [Dysgonomonas sp. 511]|uniref:META domain-containing protein n=1 Tax=Dysgonomonas sp. 511 TaxID=2302930 RepID=UPI0013D697C9|nr:META domain-containing protein [Dysgonomonas sp. 511]